MEERKDLVHLQHSHTTQLTDGNGKKSEWSVQQNVTDEELYSLPKHWNEATVFTALDFAKEFESIALNSGINHGVKMMTNKYEQEKKELLNIINFLKEENKKLADTLDKFIGA